MKKITKARIGGAVLDEQRPAMLLVLIGDLFLSWRTNFRGTSFRTASPTRRRRKIWVWVCIAVCCQCGRLEGVIEKIEIENLSTTDPPMTDPPTTEQPDPPTTEQPDPPTTEQPDPPTTEQPDPPTTEQPDPPTTEQPDPPSDIQGMVWIKGGTFTMGSPDDEVNRQPNEGPQHRVTVTGFYMGEYEVTQKEYREVMGDHSNTFDGDDLPVEKVSWFDAVEYCNKRSDQEGLIPAYTISGSDDDLTVTWNRSANGYRLPTEAEWEYACRAGTTTPFNTGDNITADQANYNGEKPYNGNAEGIYREETTAVGSFAPNDWGLYDMHGNVWEWCWGWYGDYSSISVTDSVGSDSVCAIRGGSWLHDGQLLRSAFREAGPPSYHDSFLGFRLVRSAP